MKSPLKPRPVSKKPSKKWSISTGSMSGCVVEAPTAMIAAALALDMIRPKSIGQIVECRPIPCHNEDEELMYVDSMRAFELAGLKMEAL